MLIAAAGVRSAQAQTERPVEQSSAAEAQPQVGRDRRSGPPFEVPSPKPSGRGAIFATFEVSYVGLQALDIASTLRALDNGYVEANPVMVGPAAHPAAFVAVKAASTAGTIFLARRIAGRHRVAGIVLMAALDGAYAVIAGRNFVVGGTPR